MKFAMIGLGKMGLNLVKNAVDHGNEVVVYDLNSESVKKAEEYSDKVTGASSIDNLLEKLPQPKIVWLMLPAGKPTISTIDLLESKLSAGDILLDGGNSKYKEDIEHAEKLAKVGVQYLDVGTSGGMEGARRAGNFMIGGGDEAAHETLKALFEGLAENGAYLFTGASGSGHYLKMVHNGIEYGMMQAIAEGFEILDASPYDYDFPAVAELWNEGSVIRSWLIELAGKAFAEDPKLDKIASRVHSSGEGKWTIEEALELEIPAPVITMSLLARYRSLQEDTMSGKVVAAMRNGFGGHAIDFK